MLPISEKEHKNYLQLLDLWAVGFGPTMLSELLTVAKF